MLSTKLGRKHREFEDAVLPHAKSLFTTAYNLTRDKARAEDLIQETYLRAFNSFSSFRIGTNSRAWLARIMINTFINNYHRSKREIGWETLENSPAIPSDENSDPYDNEKFEKDRALKEFIDDEIHSALDKLPPKYRRAVIMFDLQGHTYQEISETMNCAIGTVKSRLFRGRSILKKLLSRYARRRGFITNEETAAN